MTDRTHPDSGRTTGGIVEMLRDRIAELESQLSSSGFTAADMATAAAQGFRDGVASVAASPPPHPATAQTALAHELFTAAQLAPGEGISDAVARIAALVEAQQPAPTSADEGGSNG